MCVTLRIYENSIKWLRYLAAGIPNCNVFHIGNIKAHCNDIVMISLALTKLINVQIMVLLQQRRQQWVRTNRAHDGFEGVASSELLMDSINLANPTVTPLCALLVSNYAANSTVLGIKSTGVDVLLGAKDGSSCPLGIPDPEGGNSTRRPLASARLPASWPWESCEAHDPEWRLRVFGWLF